MGSGEWETRHEPPSDCGRVCGTETGGLPCPGVEDDRIRSARKSGVGSECSFVAAYQNNHSLQFGNTREGKCQIMVVKCLGKFSALSVLSKTQHLKNLPLHMERRTGIF